MTLSEGKARRLGALSTRDGIIAALAMDQRKSLRVLIAAAASVAPESISHSQLAEFKAAVTSALTPHTSAVLLDPEYGLDALGFRAHGCGLLMTYEADGYENPRPHRMLALMPHISVLRLCDLGADAVKVLLWWAPDDDEYANEEKRTLIERIGHECESLEMPFFLEPIVYDGACADPSTVEFAKRKPELVVRTMEEFSKPVYRVDVLKVEFPVAAGFIRGSVTNKGRPAWSRSEALEWYRAVDSVARRPYIYLSAGISSGEFTASLGIAAEAGARFSGVLCGRATWQAGVPEYVRSGKDALREWLADRGVRNLQAINECLRAVTPWQRWLS